MLLFIFPFVLFNVNYNIFKEPNVFFYFTFGSLKVYVPITNSDIFKSVVVQFLLKYFCQSIEYMSELMWSIMVLQDYIKVTLSG